MKLICELTETVDYELVEAEGKPKQYFIEGIFMQSERKNKNGRIYPLPVLEKEVNRYVREYVEPKRAFGELGHPDGPTVNLDRASHMITDLKKEADIKFKSGTSVPIGPDAASTILKTLDSLNSTNKKKMRDNMNKDTKSFLKILDFAFDNVR